MLVAVVLSLIHNNTPRHMARSNSVIVVFYCVFVIGIYLHVFNLNMYFYHFVVAIHVPVFKCYPVIVYTGISAEHYSLFAPRESVIF